MTTRFQIILSISLCLFPAIAAADLLYVGAGETYTDILPALNAAINGDTIIIRDGIYTGPLNKNLDYTGKEITIMSENGPEFCIIDCENNGRAFVFQNSESAASVLAGLTIQNGNVGVIYSDGGAVYLTGASPLITNCRFVNNLAVFGGGVHCGEGANPNITDCIFYSNTANIELSGYGAEGGGLDCYQADPLVTNCLFTNNWAKSFGGGINMETCNPTIFNCTVSGNTCPLGNGISGRSSSPVITNCIIWGTDSAVEENFLTPGSPVTSHNDVQDLTYFPGVSNISQDPLFVSDVSGHPFLSHTAAGQAADSPCIDIGSALASGICYPNIIGIQCMDDMTTRTDGIADSDQVDLGFHYPAEGVPTPTPTPQATTTPSVTATPVCIHDGDVTLDGSITAGDAQVTFQIALGVYIPNIEEECAADCNGDGDVTAGDAQLVFATALGTGECVDELS